MGRAPQRLADSYSGTGGRVILEIVKPDIRPLKSKNLQTVAAREGGGGQRPYTGRFSQGN